MSVAVMGATVAVGGRSRKRGERVRTMLGAVREFEDEPRGAIAVRGRDGAAMREAVPMRDAHRDERVMRGRRLARCEVCGLPESLCFCASVVPLPVATRVVVVVHHTELWKTSNTGRLAVRLLEGAQLAVRGRREREEPVLRPDAPRLVLFPGPDARLLRPEDRGATLVVPDGSWKQAQRAARRDPCAHGAEYVTIPEGPAGRYGLRRAPRDSALCTLEAIARAMHVLEGEAIEAPMLAALDEFVARQRVVRASQHDKKERRDELDSGRECVTRMTRCVSEEP